MSFIPWSIESIMLTTGKVICVCTPHPPSQWLYIACDLYFVIIGTFGDLKFVLSYLKYFHS